MRASSLRRARSAHPYRGHIRALGDRDPTTRRLLESILETEEEHAEDLVSLLRR